MKQVVVGFLLAFILLAIGAAIYKLFDGADEATTVGLAASMMLKFTHASGGVFFLVLALAMRVPIITRILFPRWDICQDVEDHFRKQLTDGKNISEPDSRVLEAFVWQTTICYISILFGVALIMAAL